MSILDARSHYRRAEAAVASTIEDPHEIILVTLRELERSLRVLASAQATGKASPDTHVNRALTAIYILQSSLDFEKGGEIAANLFRVYEFCRLRVVEAFRREPNAELAAAANHIADLLSAWREIGTRPTAA